MGYIDYLNDFNLWLESNTLPGNAQLLFFRMLNVFNRARWPESVRLDTLRLMTLSDSKSEKTARAARDKLVEAGFIGYQRGKKGTPGRYTLIDADTKKEGKNSREIDHQSDLESAPENDHLFDRHIKKKTYTETKTNLSSGGGGKAPALEAGEAVIDFIVEHGDVLDAFLNMTGDVKAQAWKIANELFRTYANRRPTQADVAKVFSCTRADTGDGTVITFPESRVRLLAYAFQQSNGAGKPGDWRYIAGIMGQLHRRGLDSVDKAEDFDYARA